MFSSVDIEAPRNRAIARNAVERCDDEAQSNSKPTAIRLTAISYTTRPRQSQQATLLPGSFSSNVVLALAEVSRGSR